MFPEYPDLITQLKTTDRHFSPLFDLHNDLDDNSYRGGLHDDRERRRSLYGPGP